MSKNTTSNGPQPVMPDFVSEEALLTVVDTNSRAYVHHATAARTHERRAAALRTERDRKVEQIKALQDEVERLGFEASQEDHRAGQEHVTATAYAQVVQLMGAELPPLPPEPPVGPVEAEMRQMWNGQAPPQTGVWANPAGEAGGQGVWDKPLDPQQEARIERLEALKAADPSPDPEL